MPTSQSGHREARAELQTWYLTSLQPKLVRAAATGVALPGALQELDRQVRDFLDLPLVERDEAA